ncbi:aminoglycoside phosphotransferase family protein [Streptomyces indicus]|uniref:Streptomycin 6-kinase n=1 Tax=Streptomyces indicus TaxID=417292 RepID=A0A1G8XJR4_9ACTN|nr:aminoglycoside phosphotransferase family protein [Streptomyces indicus]SDJ90819.1 streptomycin 6-kinase [Streptomyces indicus]
MAPASLPPLSPMVRSKALGLGRAGRRWLDELPALLRSLERDWGLTVGPSLAGGSEACVLRVSTAAGEEAVLKLALPDEGFTRQARTLRLAEGRGYVRLLRHDAERHALLLEALGEPLDQLAPPERQMDVLAGLLRQAWDVPPPGGAAEDKAAGLHALVERLWEELGRPCPEPVVAHALRCARRRSTAAAQYVLVHGDPHPGNALRVRTDRPGASSGYVFVDPEGFPAPAAYDVGVVLRDWCPQLLAGDALGTARGYCARLAAGTGQDPVAVWEWGFLERVSTGLYCLAHGAEEMGRPFLETAALLLGEE